MARFIKIPEEEEYTNSLNDTEFEGGTVEDIRKKELQELDEKDGEQKADKQEKSSDDSDSGVNTETDSASGNSDILDDEDDLDDYDDEEDEKSGILSAVLGILSGCLVIALCGAILFFYKDIGEIPVISQFFPRPHEEVVIEETDDGMVVVPDLTGYSETDAQRMLRDSKLGLRAGETIASSEPSGTIVAQEPSAGETVNPHSTITYYKSSGPVQVKMPNLVGMQTSDAIITLKENSITDYDTVKVYQGGAFDSVVATDPAYGQLTDGKVTLTICAGTKTTASPENYIGMTETEAKAKARKDKLIPVIEYAYSDIAEPGTVMLQSVDVDAPVMAGSLITFLVSAGNASERFPVQEKKRVLLALPKTATGTPYRIVVLQSTAYDTYELLADEGNTAPRFPHEIEIGIARGMKDCKVMYYEEDGNGTYIPRAEWIVKEEKKLREKNTINVDEPDSEESVAETTGSVTLSDTDAMVVEEESPVESIEEESEESDNIIILDNAT